MQIAFLGDSLTEGWPGAAYFPLLQMRLPRHELLNLGRAGDTVADLLRRMAYRGLDPVDLAFIWVGANDAVMGAWGAVGDEAGGGWGWPERLARIRDDYRKLVERTAARTSRIVCVRPIVLEADGSVWPARKTARERWTCARRSPRPRPPAVGRSPATASTSPTRAQLW